MSYYVFNLRLKCRFSGKRQWEVYICGCRIDQKLSSGGQKPDRPDTDKKCKRGFFSFGGKVLTDKKSRGLLHTSSILLIRCIAKIDIIWLRWTPLR
jgi:hypothetical protein